MHRRFVQRVHHHLNRSKSTIASTKRIIPVVRRSPVKPVPTLPRDIPTGRPDRWYPPYAHTGIIGFVPQEINIPNTETIDKLRRAGQLARRVLELACKSAKVGMTTDEIDQIVYDRILQEGAYPSPLNYMGFPKSVCSSVNEVICHGIPDGRKLEFGDVVSFDVSCYLDGVHGDNCGTIIVGDDTETDTMDDTMDTNWLGRPYRTDFATFECQYHFATARTLVNTTRECLEAGISTVRNGSCMSEIGIAIEEIAAHDGCSSVSQYRGHGISEHFHTPPYISHVRNQQKLRLETDMVFTIEPMICQHSAECYEWESDGWTVATKDGGLAAQFEHMVRVTDDGAEILTAL